MNKLDTVHGARLAIGRLGGLVETATHARQGSGVVGGWSATPKQYVRCTDVWGLVPPNIPLPSDHPLVGLQPDQTTFNSLICAFGRGGQFSQAVQTFHEMQQAGMGAPWALCE